MRLLLRRMSVTLRWIFFFGITAAPGTALAYLGWGLVPAASVGIWMIAVICWLAALSEWGVSRAVGAVPHDQRVHVWPDPRPICFVARGAFFSRGSIYVSRGMIAALSAEEYRALLDRAERELLDPGLSLRTTVSWLSHLMAGLPTGLASRPAPRRVRDAYYFLTLDALTGVYRAVSGRPSVMTSSGGYAWDNAVRKASRALVRTGPASVDEDRALRLIALPLSVISN